MCTDLHVQLKLRERCISGCTATFLEMCQIAHYVCRHDVATKMRLEQLTRKF